MTKRGNAVENSVTSNSLLGMSPRESAGHFKVERRARRRSQIAALSAQLHDCHGRLPAWHKAEPVRTWPGAPPKALTHSGAVQHGHVVRLYGHQHALQLPFLRAPLLRLPKPCTGVKGRTCADGFGLSTFGFLFSRLPRCSFFATSNLPSRFEVKDAGPYLIGRSVMIASTRPFSCVAKVPALGQGLSPARRGSGKWQLHAA